MPINDRFGEKRAFKFGHLKKTRRMAALRPEADIKLILSRRAATDPKRPVASSLRSAICTCVA